MGKITKTTIKNATDSRSWQRGVDYYDRKRVQSLLIDGNEITAKVSGTRNYKVSLEVINGDIEGNCSCPMGDGGYFCKHCVAVGLAYLDGIGEITGKKKKTNIKKVTMEDIHAYLASRPKPELLEMLIDQVKKNEGFREKLFLQLAANHKGEIAIDTFREAIDEATSVSDYDYDYEDYSKHESTCDIYDVVDSIKGLLKDGHPNEVMELTEYAIEQCDSAMNYMHDASDIYDNISKLVDLYLKACKQAKPDPEKIAQKLFTLSLEYSWFRRAIPEFSEILGKKGMAVYQKLAFEEWEKYPPLNADDEKKYSGPRSNIEDIVETLAKMDGDIEMLVAIYNKSLTAPSDYLKIAKLYREHKQRDKALEWAEKAVEVFGSKETSRLLGEFLAEEYHFRKRHDEAMEIIWERFTENTCLESYQSLKKHADRSKQLKKWRIKALECIEAAIGEEIRQTNKKGYSYSRFADHSLLVEIFLWEKTPEKAWEEATAGGCSTSLWLKLAKEREAKHPKDSIKIYQSVIGPLLERTNNDAYHEAVGYIKTIKKLAIKTGETKEFGIYLAGVKNEFKRKRNFMKMLEDI